jgi:hypothetical protein
MTVQDCCHRATLNPTLALHDHVRKARAEDNTVAYLIAVNIAGSWHCHAYANVHCARLNDLMLHGQSIKVALVMPRPVIISVLSRFGRIRLPLLSTLDIPLSNKCHIAASSAPSRSLLQMSHHLRRYQRYLCQTIAWILCLWAVG